ncbi:MAG: DUF6538 domain-containing protein [Verrucomicrobiales bacterium]
MPKIPGPRRRNNTFIICRAIPTDLRGRGPYVTSGGRPKCEIVLSLQTGDNMEAKRRYREEWERLEGEFEDERFKLKNPETTRSALHLDLAGACRWKSSED